MLKAMNMSAEKIRQEGDKMKLSETEYKNAKVLKYVKTIEAEPDYPKVKKNYQWVGVWAVYHDAEGNEYVCLFKTRAEAEKIRHFTIVNLGNQKRKQEADRKDLEAYMDMLEAKEALVEKK